MNGTSRNGSTVRAVTRHGSRHGSRVTTEGCAIVIPHALGPSESHVDPRSIIAMLDALRCSNPSAYAEVVYALDRGSISRDRTNDRDQTDQTKDHDDQIAGSIVDLAYDTISIVPRDPALTLASISVTTPRDHGAVIAALRDVARGATRGRADHGAILVVDYRPRDGAEHGYGIVIARDPDEVVQRWIDLVGASRECQRTTTITGWRRWSRGDDARPTLASNLGRVMRYAIRAHRPCDLASVSTASGILAAPWSAWLDRVAHVGPSRVAPIPRAVTRTCARCSAPISTTARRDAVTCSAACRQAIHRRRTRHGSPPMSAPVTAQRGDHDR